MITIKARADVDITIEPATGVVTIAPAEQQSVADGLAAVADQVERASREIRPDQAPSADSAEKDPEGDPDPGGSPPDEEMP